MVSCDVSQVGQHCPYEYGVIKNEANHQNSNYSEFPRVEQKVYLAVPAANIPLVKVEKMVNVGQDPYSKRGTACSR